MDNKLTAEQAERLLKAIFAKDEKDPNDTAGAELEEMTAEEGAELADDNYPETITDKVGYAQYVLTLSLEYIGKALNRLTRLDRLLLVAGRSGELPSIITNNELRTALEPLMRVREDVNEITGYLLEEYRATKPDGKKIEMREGERSCENCGDTRCANSAVAYNWDECVDSNFTKHWVPKPRKR